MAIVETRRLDDLALVALRPGDIDAVYLFGYGFPCFRGGPAHYADMVGAKTLINQIEQYAEEDPEFWRAPKLLRQLAQDRSTFSEMNSRLHTGARVQ